MSDNIPSIEPIEPKTYEYKQSKFDVADKLPFRSIICASSQGGKGILLQNLILKINKNCFERIYIFSPTASVDDNWIPVKRYIIDHLKVDNDKERYLFDDYDPTALQKIIDTQHKSSGIPEEEQNQKPIFGAYLYWRFCRKPTIYEIF